MTPKPTALELFLLTSPHKALCKSRLFSLQDKRVCTCGRDQALVQYQELKKRAEMVQMMMVMK